MASDPTPDRTSSVAEPAQDAIGEKVKEPSRKKDYIEKNFGKLEEGFLKNAGAASGPPKRSRDDSIKLIYETTSANDWLDLVEGHDDHASSFYHLS